MFYDDEYNEYDYSDNDIEWIYQCIKEKSEKVYKPNINYIGQLKPMAYMPKSIKYIRIIDKKVIVFY